MFPILIHEVSQLTGLSIRTLHYYHELGLVVPLQHSYTRYRLYDTSHLKRLEHILFFKELGFSLKDIRSMLDNKCFNSVDAFELQRRSLQAKRNQIDEQLLKIEHYISQEMRGESIMPMEKQYFNTKEYEQEARDKWGNEAVDESVLKLSHLSEQEQDVLKQKWDGVFYALASQQKFPVDHSKTETLIAEFYALLNQYFGSYDYNAFIGLGQLYVYDARFASNIDKYGEGLTVYMSEAMTAWGNKQLQK